MHRLAVAFRAFFRVLANALVAEKVEQVLKGQALPAIEHQPVEKPPPKPEPKPAKKAIVRSDALKLLEALQREARLVDFFQEPLTGYEDAQIGAVVRDLHRQCAATLERMFGLKPIEAAAEGAIDGSQHGLRSRPHPFERQYQRLRRRFAASFAIMVGKPPAANCPRGMEASGRCL